MEIRRLWKKFGNIKSVKPGDNLSTFFGKLLATLGRLAGEKLENLLYLSSLPEFCKKTINWNWIINW